MSCTTDKLVSMEHLTQKIHSKVTCAVWHPKNENILAFGTLEGRVRHHLHRFLIFSISCIGCI
nr:unnamed protein product [Callosobruchus analis]